MSNRFEHLKKKNIPQQGVDEFISAANKIEGSKLAKKNISKKDILLSISGRMDRSLECDKKTILLHLKKELSRDIDKYCHGNKQAILNYLIQKGLDQLVKNGELILVME